MQGYLHVERIAAVHVATSSPFDNVWQAPEGYGLFLWVYHPSGLEEGAVATNGPHLTVVLYVRYLLHLSIRVGS